jgi:SAM-dependent MidA family methyltransferase
MSDALRVISRLAPALYEQATIHMVETSERLRNVQRQTLVRVKQTGSAGTTLSRKSRRALP